MLSILFSCTLHSAPSDSADPGFFDDIFGPQEASPEADVDTDTDADSKDDTDSYIDKASFGGRLSVLEWSRDGDSLISEYKIAATSAPCDGCVYAFDVVLYAADRGTVYGEFVITPAVTEIYGYSFYHWYFRDDWMGYAYPQGEASFYITNSFAYFWSIYQGYDDTTPPPHWPYAYQGVISAGY